MPRLDHIVEHLFSHAGAELVLETNSTGVYRQPGNPETPVFRQTLRTGQILLLFADVVPKDDSQALLAGQPVEFRYEASRGPLKVAMEMRGADIHVVVRPFDTVRSVPTPVPRDAPTMSLVKVFSELRARRVTHLHLSAGQPAFARIDGQLLPLAEAGVFSLSHIREALATIAPRPAREAVMKQPQFSFTNIGPEAVFHVRATESRGGLSVVVRHVPREVPSPEALGLPRELLDGLCGEGLWVLSGPAGQGTSTTAAAIAQAWLNARAAVVCTVEAPIEYVLSPGRGVVQQLEVGTHVATFAEAMARARSLEADLTVVAELDEPEALAQALALADRGRLVVGVLHARASVDATRKLVSMLASRRELQLQLASVLRGIYAQRLVPDRAGGKRLAWELLPGSVAVQDLVREGDLAELPPLRTHPLEANLVELAARGEVDAEVAAKHAPDRAWFEEHLAQEARAA